MDTFICALYVIDVLCDASADKSRVRILPLSGEDKTDQCTPDNADVRIAGQRAGACTTTDEFIIGKAQCSADNSCNDSFCQFMFLNEDFNAVFFYIDHISSID